MSPIITIPKPCGQNWTAMPRQVDGARYCGECRNTVFDFSAMTDAQLLHFFANHRGAVCGRFHYTQLKRPLVVLPATSRVNKWATKMAAAFLALSALKPFDTKAGKSNDIANIVSSFEGDKEAYLQGDTIEVSGIVTREGKPLAGALIKLAQYESYSDEEGRFVIKLKEPLKETCNLYTSFTGLVTSVRSYHPAMASINYDVTMFHVRDLYETKYAMGMPVLFPDSYSFPVIKFKSVELAKSDKILLDSFARDIKGYPFASFTISAVTSSDKLKQLALKRMEEVLNYLRDFQGISKEKFTIKVLPGKASGIIHFELLTDTD